MRTTWALHQENGHHMRDVIFRCATSHFKCYVSKIMFEPIEITCDISLHFFIIFKNTCVFSAHTVFACMITQWTVRFCTELKHNEGNIRTENYTCEAQQDAKLVFKNR